MEFSRTWCDVIFILCFLAWMLIKRVGSVNFVSKRSIVALQIR